MKAIIIGGGIGGLTAALALQRTGVEVEVYEQADEPRAAGAGLSLWANAVRALNQLSPAILRDHVPVAGAIRRWDGVPLSTMDVDALRARYGSPTVVVHRVDLMHALLAETGDVVRYGKRLACYEGSTAVFEDGSGAEGDILIGADGIHSQVRGQMHPASQPVYRGYAAWRGVVRFPHARVDGMWGESWGKGTRFGLIPLTDERVYWFATANRPAGTPPADHKVMLCGLFSDWHQPIGDVINATPDEAVLYNDIADLEPLPYWVNGRTVLLGDAAHAMTPNMGQGACQAIEDGLALARMLHQHERVEDALQAYQAARLPHTRKVVLRSRSIGQMGQMSNPVLIPLRNRIMRWMPAGMALKQFDFVLRT